MNPSGAGSDHNRRKLVDVIKDSNGTDNVVLRNLRGASATVSLHGGQVLSWKTEDGEELLFTSTKAIFNPPTPVRGGIPICFPQFRDCGPLENHGFARKKIWLIEQNPPPIASLDLNGKSCTDLLLKSSENDMNYWPNSFEFRLKICLTEDSHLILISRIRNVDVKPISFSFAFHTYLSISDIGEVRLEGVETLDYIDNLKQKKRLTEQGDALTFESEVDRVYVDSGNKVSVLDHNKKRTIVIEKKGLPDIVVWNPWEKKSMEIADFGDKEYLEMLCVDGAAVENPITLKPREEWTGRLELSVLHST